MSQPLTEVDEVVISGVGGFFPRSKNLDEFAKHIFSNEPLLDCRWKEGENNVTNKLGLCPEIQYFDPAFFGIHRQQATFMDPMQRLMLERTFEALADAGLSPGEIRGKRIGVYMGSSIGENDNLFYESIVSGFGVTGHSRAMMANRVSYWLNLKGPSCAYDSNWINGIEVLQMAYDAVRYGHCEAAIVGTVNLALNSEISWLYNDMGLLSSDGTTKAFDKDASGYARSDGVIAMIIQKASDAKRSYATIMGTATMFNGNRNGTLLDVDQQSMTDFISRFYEKNCKVKAEDVDYVECYGSALKRTDIAELNAIDNVYCKNRTTPLKIGSVKPTTGHAEAAANFMSLAKILIAFETGKMPATLQYKNPNPNVEGLVNGRLQVVTENIDWDGEYAAIHGIGLASSYAHCVLKRNVKRKQEVKDEIPRLLLASTRTEEGIKEIFDDIKQHEYDPEYSALIQEFFSKNIPGHLYKGYSIMDRTGELTKESEYYPGNKRQVWFIYAGMGSQWPTMGKALMVLPIFSQTIMKCHKILEPYGLNLLDIITTEDPKIFDRILHSFVGIAAIQIALTDMLWAMGIIPDGIIGHSVGELGCSYADGCLTAEQVVMCAYSRGKASEDAQLIHGMMAAVGMGYNQIKNQLPESIEVACHNSATSCTLSGPSADMEVYVKELTDKGIFARLVNVSSIAYHSRYIKPAAPLLLKALEKVIPEPKPRSAKWICTSVPEAHWDKEDSKYCSAIYHTNNLLGSVLFEEGSRHIPKDAVCIEIAPHGLLQAILKKSLKSGVSNIPLTHRTAKNPVQFFLTAIGKLYLTGIEVNASKIYPAIEYPVGRGTAGLASLVRWEHGETWRTGLEDKLNYLVSVKDVQISINDEQFRHCIGHQMDEKFILPVSSYLSIMLNILGASRGIDINEAIFENVRFRNVLTIPKITTVPFYGMVQRGTGEFEILSGEEIICTGKITVPQATDEFLITSYDIEFGKEVVELSANDIYNEFLHRGCKYTGFFRKLKGVKIGKEGTVATAPGNLTWQEYLEIMLQQTYLKHGEKYQNITVPMIIEKVNISIANLPKTDNDVEVEFDYSTRLLNIPGLQVSNVTSTVLPISPKQISFDAIDFVPLDKCPCDSLEMALNYSINLTIQNYETVNSKSILIYEVLQNNKTILPAIKNVTDKYIQLSANINSVADPKIMIVYQNEPILIVVDGELHADTANAIVTSEAFALVRNSSKLAARKDLTIIANFVVNNIMYSFISKAHQLQTKLINATVDALTAKDVLKGTQSWATELKTAIHQAKSSGSVYLYSNTLPTEGATMFIKEIQANEDFKMLKFIFNLDKKQTTLKPEMMNEIYKKHILMTICRNGKIGTIAQCSFDFKTNIKTDMQLTSASLGDDGGKLECIGINSNDETLHVKNVGLGNIDYCTVKNKQRTIGLAYLDKATCNLVPDKTLKWTVPDSWSAEDGCTIPHAYASAYHALIQRGRLEAGENVLIHGGCSAIGLAAISIASQMGCQVFASVATDGQRAFLKKQFTCLTDKHILSSENTTFELVLLGATAGLGAHVILSTVSDSLLAATVRCVAPYGRFIQLGKIDRSKNNTIGMSVFLQNTCIMGVIPERIFNAREEIKVELQALVQQGIEKHVVRPLYRKTVQHQDFASILNNLTASDNIGKCIIKLTKELVLSRLNIEKANQFICDTRATHMIYGGAAELWVDLVEWLVLRGGRKIFITADPNAKTLGVSVSRRLALLKAHFNAEICVIGHKIQTKENASELIASLYVNGPIQAVYVLPSKDVLRQSDIKAIHYLETALRTAAPKAMFVNYMHAASGVSESRIESGLCTYNILWDQAIAITDIIATMDDILSYKIGNVFVKNDQVSDIHQDTIQALYKKLSMMMPSSDKELVVDYIDAPEQPELIQLPSSGPRKIRELPPLIIVPGLISAINVRDFAWELLYPIFCAPMPKNYDTIEEVAKDYADKIYKLHERGPYNIIGISWGGPLAIEIARRLEGYGATQVTLLDAAPETMRGTLKCLGDGPTAEVELLNRILKINNTSFLKNLTTLPSWNARVDAAIAQIGESEETRAYIKPSLNAVKRMVDNIGQYAEEKEKSQLVGKCHLIRPTGSSKYDECGLKKGFKEAPNVFVSDGDHLSILTAEKTIDFINQNVIVD